MKMQLQLVLTACIVNFGLIPVEAQNQIVHQEIINEVNDDDKIQKNFQNLLDAMVMNDTRRSEKYLGILKDELVHERHAFDEMKNELWIAQNINPNRKRNFYGRNNNGKRLIAKRQDPRIKHRKEGNFPDRQPFCPPHPQSWDFYKFHYTRMHRYQCWFCLQNYTYVERINLCADMYGRSTDSDVVSFDVPALQTDNVDEHPQCEREITVWYEQIESSLEELLFKKEEDKPKCNLGLDTFRCPITKMNVTLRPKEHSSDEVEWPLVAPPKKKKKKTSKKAKAKISKKQTPWTQDFFISVGRNLITVAVLLRSDPAKAKGENLCLQDVHYYPEAEPRIDACFIEDGEW